MTDAHLLRTANEGGDGGDADDGPALGLLLLHDVRDGYIDQSIMDEPQDKRRRRMRTLHHVKGSVEVNLARALPDRVRHGQELVEGADSGVADEHV
jgi:hypothetical protein